MNHTLIFLSLTLIISSALYSAPRPYICRNGQETEQQVTGQQQVVMIPLSLSQKPATSPQDQQDRDFFLTLLSIAANFGNVLLNKENKPVVVQSVGDMINGIVQAAEIITKYQKRGISAGELRVILARVLSDQAQQKISRVRISY